MGVVNMSGGWYPLADQRLDHDATKKIIVATVKQHSTIIGHANKGRVRPYFLRQGGEPGRRVASTDRTSRCTGAETAQKEPSFHPA
jgi:hypothetical protein